MQRDLLDISIFDLPRLIHNSKYRVIFCIILFIVISFGIDHFRDKEREHFTATVNLTLNQDLSFFSFIAKRWNNVDHSGSTFYTPIEKKYAAGEKPYSPLRIYYRLSEYISHISIKEKYIKSQKNRELASSIIIGIKAKYSKKNNSLIRLKTAAIYNEEIDNKIIQSEIKKYLIWAQQDFIANILKELGVTKKDWNDLSILHFEQRVKSIKPRNKPSLITMIALSIIVGIAFGITRTKKV